MDLGDHAGRVKFMIRDRGSNFTAAFDAVLAGAGIQIVLCNNIRTPRDCNFNGVTPDKQGDTSDRCDDQPGPRWRRAAGG
jgi:hypothetical protein